MKLVANGHNDYEERNAKPTTQKAAGVQVVEKFAGSHGIPTNTHYLAQSESEAAEDYLNLDSDDGQIFGRPCPPKPMHGFEDSRPVVSADDARALFRAARDADEHAELLQAPFLSPTSASAILTSSCLVMGPGNDGATSGKVAETVRLVAGPWSAQYASYPEKRSSFVPVSFSKARLEETDDAYLELVLRENSKDRDFIQRYPYAVQLRGGPHLPPTKNYIPRAMKVETIYFLDSSENLLAWAQKVKTFDKGTVVYHDGGALASHFGVHCALNNVPYLTDYTVKVGDSIEPVTENEHLDIDLMREGLWQGLCGLQDEHALTQYGDAESWFGRNRETYGQPGTAHLTRAASYSMFSVHNLLAEHGERGSMMLGRSAGLIYRLLACAVLGEMRWREKKCTYTANDGTPDRTSIFHATWNKAAVSPYDHNEMQYQLCVAACSFLNEEWHRGYGGPLWGACAVTTLQLWSAIRAFLAKPSKARMRALAEATNIAANAAHNGGWAFNKFYDRGVDNYITECFANGEVLRDASLMSRRFVLMEGFPTLWFVDKALKGFTPEKSMRQAIMVEDVWAGFLSAETIAKADAVRATTGTKSVEAVTARPCLCKLCEQRRGVAKAKGLEPQSEYDADDDDPHGSHESCGGCGVCINCEECECESDDTNDEEE